MLKTLIQKIFVSNIFKIYTLLNKLLKNDIQKRLTYLVNGSWKNKQIEICKCVVSIKNNELYVHQELLNNVLAYVKKINGKIILEMGTNQIGSLLADYLNTSNDSDVVEAIVSSSIDELNLYMKHSNVRNEYILIKFTDAEKTLKERMDIVNNNYFDGMYVGFNGNVIMEMYDNDIIVGLYNVNLHSQTSIQFFQNLGIFKYINIE